MRPAATLAVAVLACVLLGCGQTRRYGDDGGQPVTIAVHLERPFVKSMRYNQWRPSVGAGASIGSSGSTAIGTGVGVGFSSTRVDLMGGDGPAEAQVFIHELKWGDNQFTVPLTPGRKLHLTAKAEGGREGWESLGEVVVPRGAEARIAITLDAVGSKITVTPAEPTPAPAKSDAGPAVERTESAKPEVGSPKPEATGQLPDASSQQPEPAPLPPPGEHPDAGDKPPGDKNPPVHVEVAPAPDAGPGDVPLAPHPDPLGDHP